MQAKGYGFCFGPKQRAKKRGCREGRAKRALERVPVMVIGGCQPWGRRMLPGPPFSFFCWCLKGQRYKRRDTDQGRDVLLCALWPGSRRFPPPSSSLCLFGQRRIADFEMASVLFCSLLGCLLQGGHPSGWAASQRGGEGPRQMLSVHRPSHVPMVSCEALQASGLPEHHRPAYRPARAAQ
jgi:hypothetical protein